MENHHFIETPETPQADLRGLVLAGGWSHRMGQDKAALAYHGEMQSQYCFKLLSAVSQQVFLSIRKVQAQELAYQGLPQIHDVYENKGPLCGILSAMETEPNSAWFVLACDMPFVDLKILQLLAQHRQRDKLATAFWNPLQNSPEPLCTIYEPAMYPFLQEALAYGQGSPQKILKAHEADVVLLPLAEKQLTNVNTPEAYASVMRSHDSGKPFAR